MEITIDTHSLIWYIIKNLNDKLSRKALEAISQAEAQGIIHIPIIVLMEILHLTEKAKIYLDFNNFLSTIEKANNFRIIPFDIEILKISEKVKNLEVHDRIIISTAIFTKTPLVSKDKEIKDYKGLMVIW